MAVELHLSIPLQRCRCLLTPTLSIHSLLSARHQPHHQQQQQRQAQLLATEPQLVTRRQDPLLVTQSQELHLATQSQDPHLVTQSQEPHLVTRRQDPLLVTQSQELRLATQSQEPHLAIQSQDPLLVTQSQELRLATRRQEPHLATQRQDPQLATRRLAISSAGHHHPQVNAMRQPINKHLPVSRPDSRTQQRRPLGLIRLLQCPLCIRVLATLWTHRSRLSTLATAVILLLLLQAQNTYTPALNQHDTNSRTIARPVISQQDQHHSTRPSSRTCTPLTSRLITADIITASSSHSHSISSTHSSITVDSLQLVLGLTVVLLVAAGSSEQNSRSTYLLCTDDSQAVYIMKTMLIAVQCIAAVLQRTFVHRTFSLYQQSALVGHEVK